jgi:purine-binding chemotaxis protein CheW
VADAATGLVVRLGGSQWGVPMARVIEVLRDATVQRMPGAPPAVAGIVNHRGRVLTVADAAVALELPEPAAGGRDLLVVESGGHRFAVVVDTVAGLAAEARTSLAELDLERIAGAIFT